MGLRIAHVSDIHIRNLKYHDEYRKSFNNLYQKLKEIKPDIIVNTGDTAHAKVHISPEFVDITSEHLLKTSEIAPYHIILGNHDLNLMNLERRDAISPIVKSIGSQNIFLHTKSGHSFTIEKEEEKFNLWTFSLADVKNYPNSTQWNKVDGVNIGLFHGSISGCVTDLNWTMKNTEYDLSNFSGLDYVLLGDIHKQQFFNNRRIAYAGSLIQQNFGEDREKGFLEWNIEDKNHHEVTSHLVTGSRSFYTIRLTNTLSIPPERIELGSRIRISPPRPVTLTEKQEFESEIRRRFHPYDIITLRHSSEEADKKDSIVNFESAREDLRKLPVQEAMIREYLGTSVNPAILEMIVSLNRKYQITIDQEEKVSRNIEWKLKKLGWNNVFNYGEGNVVDFDKLSGLTGIFAPNGSGKSNFIDIISEVLFDATTKGVSKNIFLINDNKDTATLIAEISSNGTTFEIVRQIERIKYEQNGKDKEWGKTTVDFSIVDELKGKESLVGDTRPETEENIRKRIGIFDDFMLTSLMAQWNPLDIIVAKETKRKEIIFKILDLDIFGKKVSLAKEDSRDIVKRLKESDPRLEENLDVKTNEFEKIKIEISKTKEDLSSLTSENNKLSAEIDNLLSSKKHVEAKEVDKVQKELNKVSKSLAEIDRAGLLSRLAEELIELQKSETELSRIDKEELTVDKNLAEKDLYEIRLNVDSLKRKIGNFKDSCWNCGVFVAGSEDDRQATLKEIKFLEEIEVTLSSKLNDLNSKLENVKILENKISSGEKEISSIEDKSKNNEKLIIALTDKKKLLESELQLSLKYEDSLAENKEIDEKISDLRKKKKEISILIDQMNEKIVNFSNKMGIVQNEIGNLRSAFENIRSIRAESQAYEMFIQMMGKDGIPHNILASKIPLINEEINEILQNVADFKVLLEHDEEEQSIRFYIQYGEYKRRLLELGGGAEKFLASIAIRVALINLSNLPKTSMFIIDEGFGKLDPNNMESVHKMFDYLKTIFDQVIVISHVDTMKDVVDNTIDIVPDHDGYAHIEIGA